MVGADESLTSTAMSPGAAPVFERYLRLVKVKLTSWILVGLFIGWSLLDSDDLYTARTLTWLVLGLIAGAGISYAGAVLDDVQGFRDGIDTATYTASDPTGLRPISDKPLVEGSITERQAVLFATGLVVVGLAAFFAAVFLVSDEDPMWLVPVSLVLAAAAVQYSFGLKLSYIGGQEMLIALGGTGLVFLPYAALTGEVSAQAAAQGFVFGAWFAQIAVFSNIHDREMDRAAGRRNMATLTSTRGNLRGIATIFATTTTLLLVSVVVGWVPAITLLLLTPVFWHQWHQLSYGLVQQNPLKARRHGFAAAKYGGVALVAGNLVDRLL